MSLQPHDTAAEEATISAVLTMGPPAFFEISETVPLAEMFFDRRNVAVWRAIQALASQRQPLELRSIEVKLSQLNQLEAAGGREALRRYLDAPCTAVKMHAVRVRDLAERRRLIRNLRKLSEEVSGADAIGDVVTKVRAVCDTADAQAAELFQHISVVAEQTEAELRRPDEERERTVVRTGHEAIDDLSGGGYSESDFVGLAGSSGAGKTGWMLGVAIANTVNVAGYRAHPLEDPTHVLICSLEMSSHRLVGRAVGSIAKVPPIKFRRAGAQWLADGEGLRVADALQDIRRPEIYLTNPQEVHTFDDVKAAAHKFVAHIRQRFGPRARCLIELDYLGLMGVSRTWRRNMQGHEIKAYKAQCLKLEVSQALKTPVIALMQLNDGPEQRAAAGKDPAPVLGDLAGARMIRAHCDYLGFLYRPWKYARKVKDLNEQYNYLRAARDLEPQQRQRLEELHKMRAHVEFWYLKARSGSEMVSRSLHFQPEITTFYDVEQGYKPPEKPVKQWA